MQILCWSIRFDLICNGFGASQPSSIDAAVVVGVGGTVSGSGGSTIGKRKGKGKQRTEKPSKEVLYSSNNINIIVSLVQVEEEEVEELKPIVILQRKKNSN